MNNYLYRVLLIGVCLYGMVYSAIAQAGDASVSVMSRNVYVGADIFRVANVDPLYLLSEIVLVYETVVETNFPERAQALADEIMAHNPDLIGLQEVALIREQSPGDVLAGNPIPATDVELDYLQLLLDALASRGLSYVVVAEVENADVELPLFRPTSLDDIRLTDRVVILARADVVVSNVTEQNYATNAFLDLAGNLVEFTRGYVAVDAQPPGGGVHRFVNTHLETGGEFGALAQQAQTQELVQILEQETLPIILVGDFNASPDSPPEQAYQQLLDAGFIDVWLQSGADPAQGLTCCHEERLLNEVPALSSRIDLVWVRNASAPVISGTTIEVVGDEVQDKTASGLWPSDHAGVAAAFVLGSAPDQDLDGVPDSTDNCTEVANADQRDTNGDGFGNLCDADLDNNNVVNFLDLEQFKARFASDDADSDLNGDGTVDFVDFEIMRRGFFLPPGPSGSAR